MVGLIDSGVENHVPELTGDSKAQLVVFVVVLQVVLFHLLEVPRKTGVVEQVVGNIVHDIAQGSSGKARARHVEWKNGKDETIEWVRQYHKQRGGKHQPVPVHGQVVMDAVEQEMEGESVGMVRQVVVQVEQEPVETVLDKRPHKQPEPPETKRN